jgi:hypothetical protein
MTRMRRPGARRAARPGTTRLKGIGLAAGRRRGSHDSRRCRGQMETGPSQGENHRRSYLSVVRLGFRRAQRPHRCEARGPATAGRKIHQSKQPGDHTALDRQNRERAENRRTLAARTPGFPQIEISERRHSDRTARSAEPTSAKNVTSGYQERGASLRLPTRKRLAKFRQCRLRSIGPVDSIWASDHFAVVADLDVRADSATQPP